MTPFDQSAALTKILQERFPEMVTAQTLPGTHTTPLGQDIKWQTGHPSLPLMLWDNGLSKKYTAT